MLTVAIATISHISRKTSEHRQIGKRSVNRSNKMNADGSDRTGVWRTWWRPMSRKICFRAPYLIWHNQSSATILMTISKKIVVKKGVFILVCKLQGSYST